MASLSNRLFLQSVRSLSCLSRTQNVLRPVSQASKQHATIFKQVACYSTELKVNETVSSGEQGQSDVPTKGTLLRVDWLLEHQLPGLLKSRMKPFFDACEESVSLEDRLYKVNLKNKAALLTHIAKMRLYYRYMSPFNKVESIGSCVYEGEDVVVLLWRMSTMESSFLSYLPWFLTKKEQKINESEGALDVHITKEGYIYKIVNRKVTAADREGAKVMKQLKESAEKDRQAAAEKELRRQADAEWHEQSTQ